MKSKIYHRAALVNKSGSVSALCFVKPRAINMLKATWPISDDAVTCKKCLAIIRANKAFAESKS